MHSIDDITKCAVPSRRSVLSLSSTWPASLSCTRSSGSAGRVAAQTLLVEQALALGRLDEVADEVPLMLTLRETYESHALYRGRTVLAAWRALAALGDPRATTLLAQEQAWVREAAARRVPASFRESFLERNPVNRALLAAS